MSKTNKDLERNRAGDFLQREHRSDNPDCIKEQSLLGGRTFLEGIRLRRPQNDPKGSLKNHSWGFFGQHDPWQAELSICVLLFDNFED